MIPTQNIVAWGNVVPWADQRQVEQDLIISRALVEIFSDAMLRDELRFRGGTALNKLHFPASLRYSEDIDLVRTSAGPIGPILDQLRVVLEPWLGRAQFDQSPVAPKFRFRVDAEDGSGVPIRLKIEINTREIEAFDVPAALPLRVANPWFSGEASIPTYSREEMLATKLRALLQRDKGRDLYDLAHALEVFDGLDADRIVEILWYYLDLSGLTISRAQAQERMFAKLANPRFLLDMRPLLRADQVEALTEESTAESFRRVFTTLVDRLPGEPWGRTPAMKERFGIAW
jgi:predicted nucleotidyltransferase component of viral defense system